MHYVIQKNTFREGTTYELIKLLERAGLSYDVVRMEPFTKSLFHLKDDEDDPDVPFTTDKKNVFLFGAIALAHMGAKMGLNPGSMYNDNHDYEVYGPKYGDLMLNSKAVTMNYGDPLPEGLGYIFFGRPAADTKKFSGQHFTYDSWEQMYRDTRDAKQPSYIAEDTRVVVAPLREIAYEVRCWVVKGKVVTMSKYKTGRQVIYENVDSWKWLRDIVQSYVDVYQPAEAFVMDVCEIVGTKEIKIVELNCINCAGFYHMDCHRLVEALEDAFNIS